MQCLVRYSHSGIYYARARVGGKLLWRSLETDLLSVAQARLPGRLASLRGPHLAKKEIRRGAGTVGDLFTVYGLELERRVDIKPSRQIAAAILRSWPELADHRPDETLTKNRTRRQVPIVPELKRLLAFLKTRDQNPDRLGFVLNVREAQKALDRACRKLGIKKLSHHSFRYLFASSAIERGLDIPTVSRWLGHRDGGSLAKKTYGHLRIACSLESA